MRASSLVSSCQVVQIIAFSAGLMNHAQRVGMCGPRAMPHVQSILKKKNVSSETSGNHFEGLWGGRNEASGAVPRPRGLLKP